MKKIAILLSLIISVSAAQLKVPSAYSTIQSAIDAASNDDTISLIEAKQVYRNTTEISKATLDTLVLHGLKPNYNQFLAVNDWDNDGLDDIIMNIAGDPTLDSYAALFKQQNINGEVRFLEDPKYLMSIEGDPAGSLYENVGDLNGDGLLDIVISTENYHGPDGEQPSFMINKTESIDKLFVNTGSGFKRLNIDTTTFLYHNGLPEWWPTNGSKVIDWDHDGKLEILISDQNFERISQLREGPTDRLFTSFEVDMNNNITRDFVFDWNHNQEEISTRIQLLKEVDGIFYLAIFKYKGWDTVNSTFVDKDLIDGQQIIKHSDMEVVIVDSKNSFGQQGSTRKVMKRTFNGGDYVYEKGFAVGDINKDGKVEFLQQYWLSNGTPFIRLYDNDGEDITSQWLGDNFMETAINGGGNGFTLIDLNNDGLMDLLPKDGWHYTAQSHDPPKVKGDYGTFGIFMNDGEKFIQHNVDLTKFGNLDLGGGAHYFNHALDINNDKRFEIFVIHSDFNTVNTSLIELDYTSFDWISSKSDTIIVSQSNLTDTYNLQWGTSTVKSSVNYLVYAKIGVNPPEEIYDTTSTSVSITYQELLENVFEPFPTVSAATVRFSVSAIYGSDTVKVTGDDRVVFVNRYEYLSTEGEGVPVEFALHENYPNPFNPTTTLRFDLPEVSDITLIIYNMLGQRVRTFNMNDTPAGFHSIKWNATNDYGEQVGAGVYLYQLRANHYLETRKMVLLK